jgi:hypothetical protein
LKKKKIESLIQKKKKSHTKPNLNPSRKKRDFRKRVKAKSYFSSRSPAYFENHFSYLNGKQQQNLNPITQTDA